MADLNDWNVSAGSNNSAPPDGWPENTMNYSEVNNTAREGMAVLARFFKDTNGSLSAGGSADSYTVTLNSGYASYFAGLRVRCSIPATNTGASTLNVNGIGSASIVDQAGNALPAGALVEDGIYEFIYDGTNFQLTGQPSEIADSALSDNVALLNAQQVFTAATGVSSSPIYLQSTTPGIYFEETDAPTDEGNWRAVSAGGKFLLQGINDAQDNTTDAIEINRDGETIDFIRLNADTFSFNGGNLPIADGGTNAGSASAARTNLGLAIGSDVQAYDADLAAIAALAKTDSNFIVGNGSTWVAEGASTARTSLGLGSLATLSAINNSNWSGTDLALVNGGTGSSTASGARSNLGLGSLATLSAINNGNWSGTDLAVANGGTGASSAADARTNLGVTRANLNLDTSDSPQFAGINVGNASDTTITRDAAGQIAVEGDAVFTHEDGAYTSAKITFQSGGSPSGGSNGDIVFIY